MKTRTEIVLAVLSLSSISLSAPAASTTGPTGLFGLKPSAAPSVSSTNNASGDLPRMMLPPPMSGEFSAAFDGRSMFSRGVPVHSTPTIDVPIPTPAAIVPSDTASGRPESHLRFNGITIENGVAIAFIEDTESFITTKVKAGDPIARGVVKDITWSDLQYTFGGRSIRVSLGQSLLGQGGAPSTQVDWQTPVNRDNGDLLSQMRQRRLEEQKSME